MANVYSETTITLTSEEREFLTKAIEKLEEIASDVRNDTDLFVDADSVFASINESYRQNKKALPSVVHIYE